MSKSYVCKREFYAITTGDDGSLTYTLIGYVEYDPPTRGAQGFCRAFCTSDPEKIESIRTALREGTL